ncbi:hypothetical protein GCM10025865_24760 [Paraoerskovia sediminicola]|uniref:Major facilitator superfamily (MFS) profile domain-containing protein n=1 Tax=Paraoerskovia sediminicola TaxID=1138587 RepID=A0ABM8G510_9CELL|nr:hypothetical protein GCM10025865_24760 [Paraoerskovia sediminicola]
MSVTTLLQPTNHEPDPRTRLLRRARRRPVAPARNRWFALAVLMLPVLLVSIDNTVLSFALPQISASLTPTSTQLLWVVDIYPLVLAALLVPMGSLADRVGRRRLLLVGAVGFAAMSVVAAESSSAEALIAARVGLGVFGSMLMPATLSLLRNIFTDRQERRLAVAVWATGFAAGAALGPIVGVSCSTTSGGAPCSSSRSRCSSSSWSSRPCWSPSRVTPSPVRSTSCRSRCPC